MASLDICKPGGKGLFFPLFEWEQTLSSALRAPLYMLAMLYLFVGANTISDKFMSSIEVIASKKVRVRDKVSGRIVTMMRWNDTIANLTLLALGSSAPEIMLSCVEIGRNEFFNGLLGPSTIVGSAAFNLFVIVAVCIVCLPDGETRHIKENGVFAVTAVFSVAVYIWLVVIVQWSSPQVIEIWEGCVTLSMFPVLIFLSYMVDIGYLFESKSKTDQAETTAIAAIDAGDRGNVVDRSAEASSQEAAGVEDPEDREDQEDPQGSGDVPIITDLTGRAYDHPYGVITFGDSTIELVGNSRVQEVAVPVYRRNGASGTSTCRYRTERLSAVPGFDYVEEDGELEFRPGVFRQTIFITVLPKRPWEHSDQFQLILEGLRGGAIFDPAADGGGDSCTLTVTIRNESEGKISVAMKLASCVDRFVNVDSIREGNGAWAKSISTAVFDVGGEEGSKPSRMDWAYHIISVPWKLVINLLTPPTQYIGGWVCFTVSLVYIGFLSAAIIDFAELFGCVVGINNGITAITTVALGTSIPDLLASRTAAAHNEYADASIVNVTGSNSVNVLLGIGLPWTMAAIYWAVNGPNDRWRETYKTYKESHPHGAFIVEGQDLAFCVAVFAFCACVALVLIHTRRLKCGGELGGERKQKWLSAGLLVSLWCFYIVLSVWKMSSDVTNLSEVVQDIIRPENVVFFFSVGLCIVFLVVSSVDLASGNWLR